MAGFAFVEETVDGKVLAVVGERIDYRIVTRGNRGEYRKEDYAQKAVADAVRPAILSRRS